MEALVSAANAEGALNVIALPPDWANYGEVIKGFQAKYPDITVTSDQPDASSADEIATAQRLKGQPGAPDVFDLGSAVALANTAMFAPYKVATWDSIPEDAKDADGYWYGDYYGVMAFGVNSDLIDTVPKTWKDLTKPEYANAFALAGDPRASAQAIISVMAAGIANGGEPGEASGQKGMELMAEVNKAGNFVPVIGKSATIAQGATPIVTAWDYNLLSWRDGLNGNPPVEVVIPDDRLPR